MKKNVAFKNYQYLDSTWKCHTHYFNPLVLIHMHYSRLVNSGHLASSGGVSGEMAEGMVGVTNTTLYPTHTPVWEQANHLTAPEGSNISNISESTTLIFLAGWEN